MSASDESSNDVHHRVARLSITVEDPTFNERQKFLSSLKMNTLTDSDNSKLDDTNLDNLDDMKINKKIKNKRNRFKNKLKNNSSISIEDDVIDDSNLETPLSNIDNHLKGSKRRRSSVQQPSTIVRKKKFLQKDPSLIIYSDKTRKSTISSIRDLLLYSLTDIDCKLNWAKLTNRKSVDKFVVVFLRGLTNVEFGMPNLQDKLDPLLISKFNLNPNLSNFQKYFNEVIPLLAPGSNKCIYSAYSSLVSFSLSKKQKLAIQKENENRKIVLPDLYLNLDDLIFHSYPIHENTKGASIELINKTQNYKSTKNFNHEGSKTFALDCEMCKSLNNKILTRVSLTDFNNNILIDELIKPTEPIVDYLTKYSGITEEKLKGAETTLDEIQDKILSIVSSNDTLIGHSLESDLNVLKIKHPNIIDTSICFDHPRGPPSKASLKMLMSNHLNTNIQQEKFTGHDSVEDCISCMELVKLKLSKGYLYGKSYNMESLFKRIQQCNKLIRNSNNEKIPKKSLVIGYSNVKNFGHHELQIQCKNDDEIIDKFIENQQDSDLIILKLRELEFFKKFSENENLPDLKLPTDINEMYKKVNERLAKIYDSLTPNSILLVCSEHGDTREMLKLQTLSKQFNSHVTNDDKNVKETFTTKNADDLTDALNVARDALFLCTIKPNNPKTGNEQIKESSEIRDSSLSDEKDKSSTNSSNDEETPSV